MNKTAICTVLAAALMCLAPASPARASSSSLLSVALPSYDASFIQLGGFLKLLGGFFGIEAAAGSLGGGGAPVISNIASSPLTRNVSTILRQSSLEFKLGCLGFSAAD